jgi:hypothetical protein
MTVKTMCYCMGGGLGHVYRHLALWQHLNPYVITNCEAVKNGSIKLDGAGCFIPEPKDYADAEHLKKWVYGVIDEVKPDKIILDAFPAGVLGELSDLNADFDIECEYTARILKVADYMKRVSGRLPRFTKVNLAEKLGEGQYGWIKGMGAELVNIKPVYSKNGAPVVELPKQCLLVVHSGKLSEVEQLVRFAEKIAEAENIDKNIVVIGQAKGISDIFNYQCHETLNAHLLFDKAYAVFSGAGYNTMHQMSETKVNHYVIPFARPLDDQFLRLKMFGNLRPGIRKI